MATAADAEIALKLYELRREETMREGRKYIGLEWWPSTPEEFGQIHQPSNPKNVHWRQVVSYYEMAASLVVHGAFDADVFADTQGEAIFLRAKFVDLSEAKTGNPFMPQLLKLMQTYPSIQSKYDGVKKGMEARRVQMSGKAS